MSSRFTFIRLYFKYSSFFIYPPRLLLRVIMFFSSLLVSSLLFFFNFFIPSSVWTVEEQVVYRSERQVRLKRLINCFFHNSVEASRIYYPCESDNIFQEWMVEGTSFLSDHCCIENFVFIQFQCALGTSEHSCHHSYRVISRYFIQRFIQKYSLLANFK